MDPSHDDQPDRKTRFDQVIAEYLRVGQHQGRHYFSMGFVEGEGLARKLTDGPLPSREAAGQPRVTDFGLAKRVEADSELNTAGQVFDLARVYSIPAAKATDDKSVELPDRETLAEQYTTRAIQLLQRLAKSGYLSDPQRIKMLQKDLDLAPLRTLDAFRSLAESIAVSPPQG